MRLLQNFTIRMVMLTILGLFCLLWSGVGLYSVHALSEVSEGNDIDRHLVRQMTVLSQVTINISALLPALAARWM